MCFVSKHGSRVSVPRSLFRSIGRLFESSMSYGLISWKPGQGPRLSYSDLDHVAAPGFEKIIVYLFRRRPLSLGGG